MKNYRDQIHIYIQEHKAEIIRTLKELVEIPSIRSEAFEHAPYGKTCADALRYTQSLYAQNGFQTELDEDGGYLLSYYGNGEKSLGLFAHADVVPAGDDWTLTEPFEPIERDGFLIGRGTLDDKSAIVISLYCAKMLKEMDIPFDSKLVMFTGSNEETGMQDIESYISCHKAPDFSMVCDTAFPLYRGNKGILHFIATQKEPMKNLTDFQGGSAVNISLGEVVAKIGEHTFSEKGISRHGALPEGSLNAAYLMAEKLVEHPLLCEYDKTQMALIADILEKYYGEVFEIENIDKDFGRLTVTNGIAKMENGRISLFFDMRYGISVDIESAKKRIQDFFAHNGWVVDFVKEKHPFVIPEHDLYVTKCLNVYKEFTGNDEAKSNINAGGTYAGMLPRAIEIGTSLNGVNPSFSLPDGHGHVHQPDEYISVDGLLNAMEITMLMLLECDKAEENI